MAQISPALEARMELQYQFRTVLDRAAELLRRPALHQNESLVKQTLSIIQRATRWGVYLQDPAVLLEDASVFLELSQEALASVVTQLQLEEGDESEEE
jgi:hypothetical protein